MAGTHQDMAGMVEVCKQVCMVRMVADMLVGMAEEHMLEDMVVGMLVCMAVVHMEARILECKALDKLACMEEDRLACKVHKLARKDCSHRRFGCYNRYSLSIEVPKHPKKSTRLRFPVVFSL